MNRFEKLFEFFDRKESITSGVIFAIFSNVVLLLTLLIMLLIIKPFWGYAVAFSFLLYYLFNIRMFSQTLYKVINHKAMNLRVYKYDIGQLVTYLFLSVLVAFLSIFKFDIIFFSNDSDVLFFIILLFTVVVFISPAVQLISKRLNGYENSLEEADLNDEIKSMPLGKLIVINGLFVAITFTISAILISKL